MKNSNEKWKGKKERTGTVMGFKRRTKAVRIMTGILILCMISGGFFAGSEPAAAADSGSVGTGNRAGIYALYSDEGYQGDKEAGDETRSGDQKTLYEDYADCGITKKGGSYYYRGKRIKVIKDQRPDCSLYKFDPELKGKVSIKVIRNKKGKIRRIGYLTRKEAARLIRRAGL